MSLSDFSPSRYRQFIWGYSWDELKKFYIQKNKEDNTQLQSLCSFLVDLVGAVYGSKKSDGEVGLDDGEGMEDLTDEQIAEMKIMLGDDDFNRLYPHLVDD